ncbi:MFS transporter [Enterococcus lactis]|uniref:MFS transporter n=1 Tax=Enterococcus TaxID=1350 RepID=UPI0024158968|nr:MULTISPECIES: MFS transporter [Enterococcus]MDG4617620.1 MFS transporter [Enterococcus lactis]MEB4751065.1 MFS transporter [Enterococcus sp. E5-162]
MIVSQTLGGLGLSAGITVGALIAQEMLGTDSLAGLPSAVFTLGSSLAALMVGRITQLGSRRGGLSTGFILGGLGAIGVIIATTVENILFLFLALFIYGFGTATNLQARYAGSDLAEPQDRSKAISIAMVATTFGAIVGPNTSDLMTKVAHHFSLPPLTGAFILSAMAYLSSGIVLFLFLRPDPYQVAKELDHLENEDSQPKAGSQKTDNKGVFIGALIMITTQMVMVAIMTMTPIHMKAHGHGLKDVGIVIGIHIGSMYLPSLVTGILVSKFGAYKTGILSGVTLAMAAVTAMVAPPDSTAILSVALSLLGIGWNFGLISGTTMLVDATDLLERPKVQGSVDVFIALAGAFGGAISGVILNRFSYGTLGLFGMIISFLLIVYILIYLIGRKKLNERNK